jgi:hypothetical protein
MKNFLALFALLIVFTSCKQETKVNAETETVTAPEEDVVMLKGEFIYLNDAAVLNCGNKIYGVTIDEKMHELAEQVAAKKNDDYDMVPVIINAVVHPNPDISPTKEGWPEVITIKKIVKVFAPTGDSAIKVESGK